jgi:NAD(P)-dependent dehydrogenase (short-subunit alcohol dehydrogenase family)
VRSSTRNGKTERKSHYSYRRGKRNRKSDRVAGRTRRRTHHRGVYQAGDAEKLAEEAVGDITPVYADISKEEDAVSLVRAAVERFGGVDILVNNAGVEAPGLITETTDEIWNRLIDINLKGAFLCTKYAIPEMLKRGKGAIVNNSSINGIQGNHRLVAYCASRQTRDSREPRLPAAIENTRMRERSIGRAADLDESPRKPIEKHPIGRLGQPEEVVYAMLFLASDEASFITGVVLPIDSGRSIRY